MLYVAYLIHNSRQSSTIKSYISAIKAVLYNGGIQISEDTALLSALTHTCKIHRDCINVRLIIRKSHVKLLVQELQIKFQSQPYLRTMYTALIITTYYRMFRIGEVTASPHTIKACDVHIGINKPKILFILRSSKTHGKGDKLQMVKIEASQFLDEHSLCPFTALSNYLTMRKHYISDTEQFFVFRDRSPVLPRMYRKVLKDLIRRNRLNPSRYGVHGMRAGGSSDLLVMGVLVETI